MSAIILYACFSLAFAGGWVGRHAHVIEPVGFISFNGCVIFGLTGFWLHRDGIFGTWFKPK